MFFAFREKFGTRKRLFLGLAAALLGLWVFSVPLLNWLAPIFLPPAGLRAQLQQTLLTQQGLILSMGLPSYHATFFEGLKVLVPNVSIREPHKPHFFATQKADLAIRLFPLLTGKVDISHIQLESPVLKIDGRLPFKPLPKAEKKPVQFSDTAISVNHYQVQYLPPASAIQVPGIILEGPSFTLEHFMLGEAKKELLVRATGQILLQTALINSNDPSLIKSIGDLRTSASFPQKQFAPTLFQLALAAKIQPETVSSAKLNDLHRLDLAFQQIDTGTLNILLKPVFKSLFPASFPKTRLAEGQIDEIQFHLEKSDKGFNKGKGQLSLKLQAKKPFTISRQSTTVSLPGMDAHVQAVFDSWRTLTIEKATIRVAPVELVTTGTMEFTPLLQEPLLTLLNQPASLPLFLKKIKLSTQSSSIKVQHFAQLAPFIALLPSSGSAQLKNMLKSFQQLTGTVALNPSTLAWTNNANSAASSHAQSFVGSFSKVKEPALNYHLSLGLSKFGFLSSAMAKTELNGTLVATPLQWQLQSISGILAGSPGFEAHATVQDPLVPKKNRLQAALWLPKTSARNAWQLVQWLETQKLVLLPKNIRLNVPAHGFVQGEVTVAGPVSVSEFTGNMHAFFPFLSFSSPVTQAQPFILENIQAHFALKNQMIHIHQLDGTFKKKGKLSVTGTVPITVGTKPASKGYRLVATGNQLSLHSLQSFFPYAPGKGAGTPTPKLNPSLNSLSGVAHFHLTATGNLGTEPLKNGKAPFAIPQIHGNLKLSQLKAQAQAWPDAVRATDVRVAFLGNRLKMLPQTAQVGTLPIRYSAEAQWPKNASVTALSKALNGTINIEIPRVPLSEVREKRTALVKFLPPETARSFPNIWNTEGTLSLQLSTRLQNSTPVIQQVQLSFQNAGASWQGCHFPLYHLNGKLQLFMLSGKPTHLVFKDNFNFRYGNSPVRIKGPLYLATSNTAFSGSTSAASTLEIEGNVSPLVLNRLAETAFGTHSADIPGALWVKTKAPHFAINTQKLTSVSTSKVNHFAGLVGTTGPLTLVSHWQPEETAEETAPASSTLPKTFPTREEKRVPLNPSLPQPSGATATMALEILPTTVRVSPGSTIALPNAGNVSLSGEMGLAPLQLKQFRVVLPAEGLQLDTWTKTFLREPYQAQQGRLKGALSFQQQPLTEAEKGGPGASTTSPVYLNGTLQAENWALPDLGILALSGQVNFLNTKATMEIENFELAGVQAKATADINRLDQFPLELENVRLSGPQLVLASLSNFLNQDVSQKIAKPLKQGLDKTLGKIPASTFIPFEFREATVNFDEVVYNNILLSQVNSLLTLYANGYVEFKEMDFKAAGGDVKGRLMIAPPQQEQFLSLELHAKNVKANALSKALLNISNQLFGDLTGDIHITTRGQTDREMTENTNGLVNVSIQNGRLPTLAKVETLLTAANIIRGGVLGLNLNNLIRTLSPFHTDYFAQLFGDFSVANGIVYTDNLISDGKDLDLLMKGTVRMLDGYANMDIFGTMSQDVSGALGPLGKLSPSTFVDFIPGIGYLPGKQKGLIRYVPGVGFIPGFGSSGKKKNRFHVKLDGLLEDPKAVGKPDWL